MFDTDEVIALLEGWQKVLDVVIREAKDNTAFAERLGAAMEAGLTPAALRQRTRTSLPDPYVAAMQGNEAFNTWLAQYDAPTLRSIIRSFSLDPAKVTSGWREHEKLAAFISDRVLARRQEGDVFLSKEQAG